MNEPVTEREKVRRAVIEAMKEVLREQQDGNVLFIDGLSIADKAVDAICGTVATETDVEDALEA